MNISRLHLTHFRNHTDREFVFDPNVTIISGPNGSGKTNILEAIYVLATGKSFRDGDDDLTQYDHDWWKLRGVFDGGAREVRYQDGVKSLIIGDSGEQRRFSKSHRIPVVLFEPDDLHLIHGSPSARRKYLDAVIARVTPGYATTLRRYERALAQRNRLLKSNRKLEEDELFVWDVMLAEQAVVIMKLRRQVIERWNQSLSHQYSRLAGTPSSIIVRLLTSIASSRGEQSLLTQLKSSLERDRMLGTTSHGPHRDDIEFFRDSASCTTTASRGEVRSLVLALKMDELQELHQVYDFPPLLLLDDVFSELDATRQRRLLDVATTHQTIITSTHRQPNTRAHIIGLSLQ